MPTITPTIIAIETSSELASCALLIGNAVLRRESSGVRTHSQSVLPMVQELLQEAGIALKDCAAIAYGCGPGSFTGVRTACGIAQGLGFGAGLPVVPVVTLAAMALACRERSAAGAPDQADEVTEVLAVLDARMGEVYWARYAVDATGGCTELVAPTLSAPGEVCALGELGAYLACGNGLVAYADAFEHLAGTILPDIMPHAAEIGQLARIAFRAGLVLPPAQAQPLYLRNKIAFTSAERDAMRAAQSGS
jgi:tRNA threonylcarbamoyladenosine biosynthesis protein TsaB